MWLVKTRLVSLGNYESESIFCQDELDGGYNKRQSWAGAITQYNLWDFAIEDYDLENLAECRADVFGNIVRWDQEYWIERNVNTELVPTFELCDHSDEGSEASFFLFPEQYDFWFFSSFCNNLGGAIPVPETAEHYHELMDTVEDLLIVDIHERCLHASGSVLSWVGATDIWQEGVWVNPYTREPLAWDGFWASGQPSGGRAQNCAATHMERRWKDDYCDSK